MDLLTFKHKHGSAYIQEVGAGAWPIVSVEAGPGGQKGCSRLVLRLHELEPRNVDLPDPEVGQVHLQHALDTEHTCKQKHLDIHMRLP